MGISFNRFICVLLFINLLEITGCRQIKRKIEYQYGNLTVTRIDDSSTSGFWFGTAESIKDREPNFRIHWAGNDGGFRVYLIFEKDHVEFFSEYGNVELVEKSDQFYISEKFDSASEGFDNIKFIHWRDGISKDFKNTRVIQAPSYKDEILTNKENHSLIKAIEQNN